jgi:hypothetical protein
VIAAIAKTAARTASPSEERGGRVDMSTRILEASEQYPWASPMAMAPL